MKYAVSCLLLVCVALPAFACRCGDRPAVAVALAQSALVFSGRVTKLEIAYRPAGEIGGKAVFREVVVCEFSGVDALKGAADTDRKVTIITASESPACGYPFTIGTEYLVYATIRDGELWTDVCDRTRPLVIIPQDQDFGVPVEKLKFDDVRQTEIPKIKKILGSK